MPNVTQDAFDAAFAYAHTANKFSDRPVDDATLAAVYEQMKFGPTSMNCQPMRLVFVKSAEGRALLKPGLSPGNVDKTMTAPVVAIIAFDSRFYDHLPSQFPPMPTARDMFAGNADLASGTAFRNGTLQGAYFMIAARMSGLACGPMSGFDPAKVNAAFFPDGRYQANFIVNLGYGDPAGYRPRGPRLAFADVASFA